MKDGLKELLRNTFYILGVWWRCLKILMDVISSQIPDALAGRNYWTAAFDENWR